VILLTFKFINSSNYKQIQKPWMPMDFHHSDAPKAPRVSIVIFVPQLDGLSNLPLIVNSILVNTKMEKDILWISTD
jgi:hypothetical protein